MPDKGAKNESGDGQPKPPPVPPRKSKPEKTVRFQRDGDQGWTVRNRDGKITRKDNPDGKAK